MESWDIINDIKVNLIHNLYVPKEHCSIKSSGANHMSMIIFAIEFVNS